MPRQPETGESPALTPRRLYVPAKRVKRDDYRRKLTLRNGIVGYTAPTWTPRDGSGSRRILMRTVRLLGVFLTAAIAAHAGIINYGASLVGSQEVPPSGSPGTGTAFVT